MLSIVLVFDMGVQDELRGILEEATVEADGRSSVGIPCKIITALAALVETHGCKLAASKSDIMSRAIGIRRRANEMIVE